MFYHITRKGKESKNMTFYAAEAIWSELEEDGKYHIKSNVACFVNYDAAKAYLEQSERCADLGGHRYKFGKIYEVVEVTE